MPEWSRLTAVAGTGTTGGARIEDDRPVAWHDGTLITRKLFLRDVAAWCSAFAAMEGARFALYFEDDSYTFAAALYGAWHAGKQVWLPGNRLPATLDRLRAQVDGWAGDVPGGLSPHAAVVASPVLLPPLDAQNTSLVIHSSGSTGEATAIHKRLAQLDHEVAALEACFPLAADDPANQPPRILGTVSHQHIYGLLFCVLWPLAAGRPFASRRLLHARQMADAIAQGPCVLVSSPAHFKRLPSEADGLSAGAALRLVFSSGGPLPADAALSAADRLGCVPTEILGSSETGGIAWRRQAVHGERWQPLPGVEWRIEDDQLAVRSWHLPDDTWYRTADRATPVAGGFALAGRADRIVKIEEKRVSLSAVERAVGALPEIADARALVLSGAPGDRVAVVAVLTEGGQRLLAELGRRRLGHRLAQALSPELEPIALPRRWRYVQALPVDAQGKSAQALLQSLFRPRVPKATWRLQAPEHARVELDIDPALAVFDGHFDELPVLPGVAQLDWAIAFGGACFALPPRFLRAEAVKFHRPVLPPATLLLDLQWNPAAGRLSFSFESALGVHASGRAVFGEAA
ncbi:AMP-binding protein [Xylophilus sp. GOD-11R]|uniref:AMP-binding protein n=1 Tax=Xylophilus sp. GOD-11R TaxID=3089814 RepID=UPI00298C8314|nr:AMP-binding protein [Xylophilus sp. GOD-11R]WPB57074.1 AMP-binding protein [Xylophilus sp. GOD-11R]